MIRLEQKDIIDILPPQLERSLIEIGADEHGYQQFAPGGLKRVADMHLTVTEGATKRLLDEFRGMGTPEFDIMGFRFKGAVTSIQGHTPIDGECHADVTIKVLEPIRKHTLQWDSAVDASLIEMCDSEAWERGGRALQRYLDNGGSITTKEKPVRTKRVITKEQVEANRYYVGSATVFDKINRFGKAPRPVPEALREGETTYAQEWGHPSIEEATAHAERMMEQDCGDDQVIVQIVRVVKRKKNPNQNVDFPTPKARR